MFLDFDGTLSPIVADFEAARPFPGTEGRLAALARKYARVAVISGRPVAYLERYLAGSGVLLAGLYGMERLGPGSSGPVESAEPWRAAITAAAEAAEGAAPAGVVVERKGLATTIHFRVAPEHETWAETFAQRQAAERGLVVHPGKMSVELRPPVSTDKGTVVDELASGLSAVLFMGDDVGDLPAFEALARLHRQGKETLGVAVASAETPPELIAAADLSVSGPEGAAAVLDALAA